MYFKFGNKIKYVYLCLYILMKLYNTDLFKLLPGVKSVGVPNALVVNDADDPDDCCGEVVFMDDEFPFDTVFWWKIINVKLKYKQHYTEE